MPETFFILLAGGVMLAAAVTDPKEVTVNWLRLCGILALVMTGICAFFLARREAAASAAQWSTVACVFAAILAQLAFVQVERKSIATILAWIAFFIAIRSGADMLLPLKRRAWQEVLGTYAACVGIASMCGLALMDMLLGHAYLTASKMTMSPFRRLNGLLAGTIVWRAILAGVATWMMTRDIWLRDGLFILTRWLVGLLVPAVFVYMAHDCIKRRATQSATGILYVAGVLIFIGEIVGLYLVRTNGLPF